MLLNAVGHGDCIHSIFFQTQTDILIWAEEIDEQLRFRLTIMDHQKNKRYL